MMIAIYDYTYGAGNQANRRIVFSRPLAGIRADVFILNDGVLGQLLATIPGQQISVSRRNGMI
jgi:hypothetical protein